MKTGIHPSYYVAQVVCACGNAFTTRATKKVIKLDICSGCHPFYTGKQRLVDRAGRVDRFQKRFAKTGGKTIERAKAEVKLKKLDAVMYRKAVRNTLSTAPTQASDAEKAKKSKKEAKKNAAQKPAKP
ncbi:MAG: 50S ribosomal protein L31 [Elusimicrobia bacterium]|nr:50S ribosomal protein L31 [Elusimicrobiota bacterium]